MKLAAARQPAAEVNQSEGGMKLAAARQPAVEGASHLD